MLLLLCLLLAQVVYSQPAVSIGQQYHCEDTGVLVPVYASGFSNVGSLQLNLEFDTMVLHYHEVVNMHTQLNGGNFVAHFSDTGAYPFIAINWWSMNNPLTIQSGKLFDLKFHFYGGFSAVAFTTECEVALADLNIVDDAVFNNGSINTLLITGQPQNLTANQNEQAVFSVYHNGATAFQWQVDAGNGWNNLTEDNTYSGVYSDELVISNVQLQLDNNLYRCLAVAGECIRESDEALLKVSALGLDNRLAKAGMEVFPNPFNEKISFIIKQPVNNLKIELVNLLGQTVYFNEIIGPVPGNVYEFQTGEMKRGIYFLRIVQDDIALNTVRLLKQ